MTIFLAPGAGDPWPWGSGDVRTTAVSLLFSLNKNVLGDLAADGNLVLFMMEYEGAEGIFARQVTSRAFRKAPEKRFARQRIV